LPAQAPIPLRELREELRIVSNDTVPGMLLTQIWEGSTVLPDGRIIAVFRQEGAVRVFDASGKLLRILGRKGSGPGEYQNPSTAYYVGDTIWVHDFSGLRYVSYSATDYRPLAVIAMPGTGGFYYGPIPGMRSLYKGSAGDTARLGTFDKDGKPVVTFDFPFRQSRPGFTIEYPDDGRGRAADALAAAAAAARGVAAPPAQTTANGMRIRTFGHPLTAYSTFSRAPGGREGLLVESGEIWGGKPGQLQFRRVNLMTRQVGAPITASLTPRPVAPRVADSIINVVAARTNPPELAQKYRGTAKVPQNYPAFKFAEPGLDGSVWIEEWGDRTARVILDPTGKAVGRVRFPNGFLPFAASLTQVWGYMRDADDLPIIIRYRVQ
jgi:hypothetical protein